MTTTSLTFGQGTISAVLGEGTVPAKFSVDSTGAVTGLAAPDGTIIPINGTSCDAFGASPSASASVNAAAINAALANGGLVTLTTPGTYSVNASLVMDDDTEWRLAKGVIVQRAASTNAPLVKNKYEAYLLNNADLSRTASATVVVNDKNHTRTVGETVIVGQCQTAAYNGVVTVTAVTADTWSYTSGGSATDTGGLAGYYATIIPVRETVLAASVSASSGLVTVTTTAASAKLKSGDNIWVASTSTDANFVGEKVVASVDPGVSFTYYSTSATGSPVGNLMLNFNTGIKISGGGKLDGNRANQASPGAGATLGMRTNTVSMSMVSRFTVSDQTEITGAIYRALGFFNCAHVDLDFKASDCLVAVQFEGSGRDLLIRKARGESIVWNSGNSAYQPDDFIAMTAVHYIGGSGYDNTTTPYALGNFTFNFWDIDADNCLNVVKITGYTGTHYAGTIDRLVGGAKRTGLKNGAGSAVNFAAGIKVMDDTAALTGAVIDYMDVRYVKVHDNSATAACYGCFVQNTGTNGSLSFGYVDDGADIASMIYMDQTTGTTNDLTFKNQRQVYDMATNTKPRYLVNSGTVNNFRIKESVLIPPTTGGAASISVKSGATVKTFTLSDVVYGGNADHSGQLISCAGIIGNLVFNNFMPGATAYAIHQPFYYSYHSGGTLNVYFNNSELQSDSFFSDDGGAVTTTVNYYLNGFKWTPGGNNFIQTVTASTHNIYGGTNNSLASQVALISSGSQVINFYCEAARVDVTTNVRLGKPMGAKAWNTNAALGTLGVAGPVISDGTNWHLMTDTTKLY